MKTPFQPVKALPTDAKPDLQADWLELVAFFSARGVARLDDIDNAEVMQQDEPDDDDAAADAASEDRRSAIEDEIFQRSSSAGDAYPFFLSDDGEELVLKPRGSRRGAAFYLTCLIATHFIKSAVLSNPPSDKEIIALRRVQFQILSTLAVAGHVGGPAVSVGWPRASGETLEQVLKRICDVSGTGSLKMPIGQEASRRAKDGGMDVVAWRPSDDGTTPPAIMYFAQAASGKGWKAKSAIDELSKFLWGFFIERPACNVAGVTVVPFRLSQAEHKEWGARHGHILDRTRIPMAALRGVELAAVAGVSIDEVARVHHVTNWLWRYRASRLTA